MRKVTEETVKAFFAGKEKTVGNTSVIIEGGVIKMLLHGNCIALRDIEGGPVQVRHAGWTTNTTKERLNGILYHSQIGSIYQKDFTWYWKDGEQFPDGWIAVK